MNNLIKNIDNSIERIILNNIQNKILYIPTVIILIVIIINVYTIINIKNKIQEISVINDF